MSDVTGGSSVQSSLAKSEPKVFSLTDEKSVLTLLRHIHQSPLTSDDKNELRDTVFAFRNTSNAKLTPELITQFADNGFTLSDEVVTVQVKVKSSVVPKVVSQFGVSRPSPQFGAPTPTVQDEAPVIEPAPEVVAQEPVVSPTPEVTAPVIPAIEPEVVKVENEPVPEVVAQDSVVPEVAAPVIPTIEPEVTKVEVEPVPEEVPEPVVVPVEQVPASTPVADAAGALGRIKEIKKEVNLLVGNPVNLIDVNNEVGREYMNSLLDAMKKNNGGTPDEVAQAMVRLEEAFVSVKETVSNTEVATVPAPAQPPVAEPVPEEVSQEPVVPPAPEVAAPVIPEVPAVEESAPVVSGFASVHQTHVQESVPEPEASPEVQAAPASSFAPVVPSVEEQKAPDTAGGIMSVAKEKQIQDLMTTEKQQAAMTDQQRKAEEIAAMDPLMTPEVTSGLQQLLSEWSLFKSSGIFGTGPSGMEHQLYKKLAPLNMTAVVAGRFEGATPEIKRSITDYMNGWRYEEGIMQQQGELFEHYLRRVIKHILDKRN